MIMSRRRVVAAVAAGGRPQVPTLYGGRGERSLPLSMALATLGLVGG